MGSSVFSRERRKVELRVFASLGIYLAACGGPSGSNLTPQSATATNSASTGTPFLVSSGATVYLASANFKTLTPHVTAPSRGKYSNVVNATAMGPNGELFVSNCTDEAYYGIFDCRKGETDVYQSASSQPTVIPNGGAGVAVARNGRFVTLSTGGLCDGCVPILSEFNPGTTTPVATAPSTLFCYHGFCDTPVSVSIDSTGKHVYFWHELEYTAPYNFVTGRFAWAKWTANFDYYPGPSYGNAYVPQVTYIASSGTFYQAYNDPTGIYAYAKNSNDPTSVIPTTGSATGVAVYRNNTYAAFSSGYPGKGKSHIGKGGPYVSVYSPGQVTPTATYPLPWAPTSLSLSNPWKT